MFRETSLALSLLFAACSGKGGMAAPSDMGKMPAPVTLRSVESNAEGISDAAKVADWTKAQAILGEAMTTWGALKGQLDTAGAAPDEVAAIDALLGKISGDLTNHQQRAAETDANAISLKVPDLFDLFVYAVPSDVLRGDGVFRQLQIEAEYSDWTTAARDLTACQDVWSRLKPLVAMQAAKRPDIPGSSTVVNDLDGAISRSMDRLAAQDTSGLQQAAQDGLDFIDVAEAIFK